MRRKRRRRKWKTKRWSKKRRKSGEEVEEKEKWGERE